MNILLAWEINKKEELYLKENLRKHKVDVVKTVDTYQLLKKYNLSEVEIIIAGLANDKIIKKSPKLKFIQSMISGVSHIDLEIAKKRKIIVSSTKGANAPYVAEHVLMMMLNLSKNTKKYFLDVKRGVWDRSYSNNLRGKTLGIIGFGNVGKEVSKLARAFGMKIIANRYHPELGDEGFGLEYVGGKRDLEKILSRSDFVVLSVPKTKETINLINKNTIKYMKDGAYLINISRGVIVDEYAVYEALKEGKIRGFATDVFPQEPNNFKSSLYHQTNVICTPHVAANSLEAKLSCLRFVISNIERFVSGKKILNIVNYDLGY